MGIRTYIRGHIWVILILLGCIQALLATPPDSLDARLVGLSPYEQAGVFDELVKEYVRKDPVKAMELARQSLVNARSLQDSSLLAKALNNMGITHRFIAQYDSASFYSFLALEIGSRHVSRGELAYIYTQIGSIHRISGRMDSAEVNYSRAKAIYESIEDKGGVARVMNNLGTVYRAIGEYDKALDYYEHSLEIKETLKDRKGIAITQNNLGKVLLELNQYEESISYFTRALKTQKELKNPASIAIVLNNLGEAHLLQDKDKEAKSFFLESMELREGLGDKGGVASVIDNIGEVYMKQKDYQEALYEYVRSLEIRKMIGDSAELAKAYFNVGKANHQLGNYESGIRYLEKALGLAKKSQNSKVILGSYEMLSAAYYALNDFQKAYQYTQSYQGLNDTLLYSTERLLRELEARHKAEQREKERDLFQREYELQKEKEARSRLLLRVSIVALLLFIVIAGLLYWQAQLRKRVNQKLERKNELINRQNAQLQQINQQLASAKKIIEEQNSSLEQKVKNRTQELFRANEELVDLNREMDNFAYRASHDIRGPLARILGLCSLALSEIKDQGALMYVSLIDKVSKDMDSMLIRLLIIYQIKSVTVARRWLPLEATLMSIISEEFGMKKIVGLQIDIDKEAKVFTDKNLLKIIISNLLDNAIQFRDSSKGDNSYIRMSSEHREDHTIIRIHDNGVGIEAHIREKIFDMFFRGHQQSRGLGLGLHAARLAMRKLGGELFLDTEIKNETCFVLVLPLRSPLHFEIENEEALIT